jgi:PD-(D/E)XK nuclease superfamily
LAKGIGGKSPVKIVIDEAKLGKSAEEIFGEQTPAEFMKHYAGDFSEPYSGAGPTMAELAEFKVQYEGQPTKSTKPEYMLILDKLTGGASIDYPPVHENLASLKGQFSVGTKTKTKSAKSMPAHIQGYVDVEKKAGSTPPPLSEDGMITKTRTLSYSSLSTYMNCQHTFLGKYILGLPKEESIQMLFGSTVHEACEMGNLAYQVTGEVPDPDEMANHFIEMWTMATEPYPAPTGILTATLDGFWDGQTFEGLLAAGSSLVSLYFKKYASTFVPIEVEGWHEMNLNEKYPKLGLKYIDRLVGKLDLVCPDDVVVDYKTRTSAKNPAWLEMDLQPTVYATLLGKPITAVFVEMIRNSKGYSIKVTQSDRTQENINWFSSKLLPMFAKEIDNKLDALYQHWPPAAIASARDTDPDLFKRMIDAMAQIFPPSPNILCGYCSFRPLCGYHFVD